MLLTLYKTVVRGLQTQYSFFLYRDGRLKEGDELLWINGHSLIGITQQEAVDLLRASPKLIKLVISTQVRGNLCLSHSLSNDIVQQTTDSLKIYINCVYNHLSTYTVNYDHPGECSPQKDCLR